MGSSIAIFYKENASILEPRLLEKICRRYLSNLKVDPYEELNVCFTKKRIDSLAKTVKGKFQVGLFKT